MIRESFTLRRVKSSPIICRNIFSLKMPRRCNRAILRSVQCPSTNTHFLIIISSDEFFICRINFSLHKSLKFGSRVRKICKIVLRLFMSTLLSKFNIFFLFERTWLLLLLTRKMHYQP